MDEKQMDHHHHHHHHHHEMTPSSTDSNPDSTFPVNGLLTSHQHHHDHHHMNTFHIWAASKLLVQSWSLDSPLGLVMAILFSTFLSVVYEGSKFYYHIGKILVIRNINKRRHRPLLYHYISRMWKSLAFMVHFLIGYILMLCAMTFNLWVLAAVCLGSGIGYYFLLPIVQYVIQRDMDARVRVSQGTMTRMVLDTACAQRRRKTGDREDENGLGEDTRDVLLDEISEVTDSLERETVV